MPKHPMQVKAEEDLARMAAVQAAPAPAPSPAPAPASPAALPPAPTPAPAPAPGFLPPAPAAPEPSEETFKQKFVTTEGMLRAEKARHIADLAAERARVAEVERQHQERNQALQQQLDAATERLKVPEAPIPLTDQFSAEDIENLGPEYLAKLMAGVDARVARQVKREVAAATDPIKSKLAVAEAATATTRVAEAKQRSDAFYAAITAAIPNWDTWAVTNKELSLQCDPRLSVYLAERAPGTMGTRQQQMDQAQANFNSTVVVELLQDFINSLGKTVTVPDPAALNLPTGSPSGEAPPPPPSDKLTVQQIERFQSDLSHGLLKGQGKYVTDMLKRILVQSRINAPQRARI